jgi:hypothetical protein
MEKMEKVYLYISEMKGDVQAYAMHYDEIIDHRWIDNVQISKELVQKIVDEMLDENVFCMEYVNICVFNKEENSYVLFNK